MQWRVTHYQRGGWCSIDTSDGSQTRRLLAGDPLTPSLLSVARSDAFLNQKIFAGDRVSRTPPDFNSFWLKENVRSFLKPQFDIVNYLCDEAYTEAEGNPELKRLYGFNSASRPPDLPTDAVPVRRL